jgi:PIN domain nuclease of toxin-antitoxin system
VILLDTHVLIWALSQPERLSAAQRSALTDPTDRVVFSAVSILEIGIKARRFPDVAFQPSELAHAARQTGFHELPLDSAAAGLLRDLPAHHTDPFDRMLITQAIAERAALATQDQEILRYAPLLRFLT